MLKKEKSREERAPLRRRPVPPAKMLTKIGTLGRPWTESYGTKKLRYQLVRRRGVSALAPAPCQSCICAYGISQRIPSHLRRLLVHGTVASARLEELAASVACAVDSTVVKADLTSAIGPSPQVGALPTGDAEDRAEAQPNHFRHRSLRESKRAEQPGR